ncbi:hypothetical protein AVDCRST_MAG94-1207 [uncultured Leptolyngbya sp.]|uniref:Uncharacterized protein n=1 Tax=uncultured Leptolyngbya sp. TaxID=332963 RepID=A0A6J4KUQ2_9CYAN|nr:hypothetical protein AVDCRST_MAG94-1207 [uncultured Leptolyngbya sp.]
MLTPTNSFIFQVVVSLSAYPWAFPRAFASETILLSCLMRLTDYSSYRPNLRECRRVTSFLAAVWRWC